MLLLLQIMLLILQFSFVNQLQTNSYSMKEEQRVISFERKEKIIKITPEKPQISKNLQIKKKSLFHNFQKHLVTTLKKTIQINKSFHKKNSKQQLISLMWQNFLKSKVFNKKILYFLFGVVHQEKQYSTLKEKFQHQFIYYKRELFEQYKIQEIEEAQQEIRRITVVQISQVLSSNNIIGPNRRIAKNQQFSCYMKEFIDQINHGPLRKRIPKQSKIQMVKLFLKPEQKTIRKQ